MRRLLRQFSPTLPLSEVESEIQCVLKAIIAVYQPTRVIVFGSAARGDFYEDSDFDFLVIVRNKKEVERAWTKLKDVRPHSLRPLDVIFRTEEEFVRGFSGGASLIAQESGRLLYCHTH